MLSKILPLICVFSMVLSLSFFAATIDAAGILSEPINVDNARRGQTHWEELLFINSDAKDLTFKLAAEGAIAQWVTFYAIDGDQTPIIQLVVPAKSNLGAKVKFVIPDNAQNGKYQGSLVGTTLVSEAEMSSEMTAQITQKLDREVNITVTDNQILDFNTIFTPVAYVVAKDEPFIVKMIHENHGNVDIRPNVELRISQNGNEVFKAVFPYPDNTNPVQPNERKEILDQVKWRTVGYEAGKYDVVLSTFENDEFNQKEEFIITIGAKGNASALLNSGMGNLPGNVNFVWLVLAGIMLFAVAMFFLKNKALFIKK